MARIDHAPEEREPADFNEAFTRILAEANGYFPQAQMIPERFNPMAVFAALKLLKGKYRGLTFRLSDVDSYLPPKEVALAVTRDQHRAFGIAVHIVPDSEAESANDERIRKGESTMIIKESDALSIFLGLSANTMAILEARTNAELEKMRIPDRVETGKTDQLEGIFAKYPEVKARVLRHLQTEISVIEPLVRERNNIFRGFNLANRSEMKSQQYKLDTLILRHLESVQGRSFATDELAQQYLDDVWG